MYVHNSLLGTVNATVLAAIKSILKFKKYIKIIYAISIIYIIT